MKKERERAINVAAFVCVSVCALLAYILYLLNAETIRGLKQCTIERRGINPATLSLSFPGDSCRSAGIRYQQEVLSENRHHEKTQLMVHLLLNTLHMCLHGAQAAYFNGFQFLFKNR